VRGIAGRGGASERQSTTDLHFHILPGIDDGPPTLSEALDLADAAANAGTTIVAATPHLRDDHPGVRVAELAGRCVELNRSVADAAIPLRVVPAAEVDLIWAYEASDDELRLASYAQAGSDILIETPRDILPPHFEQLLFGIRARGYRILLAHPERNRTFQEHPERLRRIVEHGVLLQVNAGSITRPESRSRTRALARTLVQTRLAHVIASDAHTASGWRPPGLGPAIAEAERLDRRRARRLVSDWPNAILLGEDLPGVLGEREAAPRWARRGRRAAS
jgi:protein-tyrosine phosphatase